MEKQQQSHLNNDIDRRKFIATATMAAGAALLSSPFASLAGTSGQPSADKTVGEIMDAFINEVPGAPFSTTVDTLKAGSRDIKVTGIVTTMFATLEVIQKAIASGANFIIAHEPTFYNHLDETKWLEDDEVYKYKADLLKKHQIAVWRNHDYIHQHRPDGVVSTVVSKLGWTNYYSSENSTATIPAFSLKALIQHAKKSLGIVLVRYIGDPEQSCKKILLIPGAAGGRTQIRAIGKVQPDVLVCGEIQEWETAEYVRDARTKGQNISLVILGHIASEEPGSEYMADWLRKKMPDIKVSHVPAGNSLSFL